MPWYNPTDPKQRNYMIGGAIALIAIVPFRMYLLSPRQEANLAVQERIEALEGQNRRASVQAARGGGDLEERNAALERHVAKLEELIPAAEDVAGLLNDIAAAARRFDIEPQEMTPEPTETAAFYNRTSYEMAAVGEYHNMARYLTEIASLSRIVTPIELDVSLFDRPELFPEMESPVLIRYRIVTYVLPAAPPAPAEVPGA